MREGGSSFEEGWWGVGRWGGENTRSRVNVNRPAGGLCQVINVSTERVSFVGREEIVKNQVLDSRVQNKRETKKNFQIKTSYEVMAIRKSHKSLW